MKQENRSPGDDNNIKSISTGIIFSGQTMVYFSTESVTLPGAEGSKYIQIRCSLSSLAF